MPCTVVFYHDAPGETLMITLRDAAGTVVNGSGNALIESAGLRYSATITQAISGWFLAQIFAADGLLYTGSVKTASDGGVYRIDDPAATIQAVPTVPTAGQNAAAVWGALDRTLTGFDASGLVIENVTVDAMSPAALAQLAGTRVINLSVPALSGQQLNAPLVRGDTYSAAVGSAIEFSRSDFPDLPDGTTAILTARKCDAETPTSFEISGTEASIPVRAGAKVVRFEPNAEQTRLWDPGKYEFDVQLTWPDGKTRTFVGPNVFLRVLSDVTAV